MLADCSEFLADEGASTEAKESNALGDRCEAMLSQVVAYDDDWSPVDTAPEDGQQILVAWRGGTWRDGIDDGKGWKTTVVYFHDGDWQLVENDTHAFDNIFNDFELWKPIDLPKDLD